MRPAGLNGINALRAISALMIASFHVSQYLSANGRSVWFPLDQTPGIHLFLVISGFVLTYALRADDTPVRFILRRMGRIAPLYWLLTALVIALASWRSWLFPGIDLSPRGMLSSFAFLPDRNRLGLIQPNLFVGWTLNYIVLNYLAFALAMTAPERVRPYIAVGVLAGFMALANLVSDPAMRDFWTDWTQFEFVGGVVAGVLIKSPHVSAWASRHAMWPFMTLGVGLLLAALLSHLSGLPRMLACGLPATLIVFSLAAQDLYRRPVGDGFLPWLGRMSYSIYLVHPIVISLVGILVIGKVGPGWLEIVVMIAATFAVTLGAATLCYRLIESPVSGWFNRRAERLAATRPSRSRAGVMH